MSEDDFAGYVAARYAGLVRTAYLLTGNPHEAEDLVQSTLARAFRHWKRISRDGNCDAYVRRALVNQRISRLRRHWSREQSVAVLPEPAVPEPAGGLALRDELWRALGTLPRQMRAVLVLRYWEDLSEADTAAALGCSAGTVKSQASRGLARLRAVLENDAAEVHR